MFFKTIVKILDFIKKKIQGLILIKNPSTDNKKTIKTRKIHRQELLFQISKDIFEYVLRNKINIDEFIKNFDQKSKIAVKLFLERSYYVFTHNLLDTNKQFNKKERLLLPEVKKFAENQKLDLQLPIEIYENSIFYYDYGLKCLPKKVINSLEGKDFIDGGAYVGDTALMFEKNYNPKNIYAFEPEIKNYAEMLKTIDMNNLNKTIPINMALAKKEGVMKIKSDGINSWITNDGDQDVNVTTIDNFASENNLLIGVIKLDLEGYELYALDGAKISIKKFEPVLLIAIYHNGKEFFETIDFIKNISPNYKFIIRKLNPEYPFVETMLIAWVEQ